MKNNYPEKLINNKINEIKQRNFQPSELRDIREKDYRCEKVARKIISTIKNYTPEFNVNVCWSNITLERIFGPKLKFKKSTLKKLDMIYEFKCECGEKYIGETRRQLTSRISEHERDGKNPTAIQIHVKKFQEYKNNIEKIINETLTH